MDILGDDLVNSLENKSKSGSNISSRPLPSFPGTEDTNDLADSLEEPPPEIPQRTDARLELVDFKPESVGSPTYDIPGAISTGITSIDADEEDGGGGDSKSGYEQPTPCECSGVIEELVGLSM